MGSNPVGRTIIAFAPLLRGAFLFEPTGGCGLWPLPGGSSRGRVVGLRPPAGDGGSRSPEVTALEHRQTLWAGDRNRAGRTNHPWPPHTGGHFFGLLAAQGRGDVSEPRSNSLLVCHLEKSLFGWIRAAYVSKSRLRRRFESVSKRVRSRLVTVSATASGEKRDSASARAAAPISRPRSASFRSRRRCEAA